MRDQDDDIALQPAETLESGPARPSLFSRVAFPWRQPVAALLAFMLGVAACAGTVLWWQGRPEPPPFRADRHDVALILFEAEPLRTPASGRYAENRPLQVGSAVLLSGPLTSTILRIGSPTSLGLGVRAPALPVTVSPARRFRSVSLQIIVRDCRSATRWTPRDRPFTIRWRDEYGKLHDDRAGDFDGSLARALLRYIAAVC